MEYITLYCSIPPISMLVTISFLFAQVLEVHAERRDFINEQHKVDFKSHPLVIAVHSYLCSTRNAAVWWNVSKS